MKKMMEVRQMVSDDPAYLIITSMFVYNNYTLHYITYINNLFFVD